MVYYLYMLRRRIEATHISLPEVHTMSNSVKAQQEAKRRQEDAVLNRVLVWFGCAAVAEFILLLINRFSPGLALIQWLTILVPVVAVLALVYYLFQRDFFCITVVSACGILCLQLYRRMFFAHPFRIQFGFGVAFLLLAAAVVMLILLQRGKQLLPKVTDQLIPRETNFALLYITCALTALVLALTLILGATFAYYLLFVLVGWLFIMAVYYIVKLM